MKSLYVLLALAAVTPAFAQNAPSTEVLPDGRVTFRLKAPDARDVQVHCDSVPGTNMIKDDQGVWSLTTAPLEPGFYAYTFNIDGVRAMDLNNPSVIYNLSYCRSEVHIPGPASLPWEVNDVPHGIIHRHFYHSKAADDDRVFFVYTPPGYKASSRTKYPVLCLLHGMSDDATAWWNVGKANIIMDNLIARGEAKPMVVVMPLGYGTIEVLRRGQGRARDPGFAKRNASQFRASLLDEVLPQVEADYRVSTDRKARAIAGLSMGGAESLTVGLNALDRFAWIGAFSSGGVNSNYTNSFPALDAAAANQQLRLLWISCGKDDRFIEPNRRFVHWLESKDVHCTWTEIEGGHAWPVWRRNLAAFAPLLFR